MSEHIISDEVLQSIQRTCYETGKAGREAYTVRGPDGPEIIRCRDCKKSRESGWKCTRFSEELYDVEQEIGELVMANVCPDGHCAWAERRNDG